MHPLISVHGKSSLVFMDDATTARVNKLLSRIEKVWVLMHCGATEGERSAAAKRHTEMCREYHRLTR